MSEIVIFGELNKRNEFSDSTLELVNFASEFSDELNLDISMVLPTREKALPDLEQLRIVKNIYIVRSVAGDRKAFVACSRVLSGLSGKGTRWFFFPPSFDGIHMGLSFAAENEFFLIKGITDWEKRDGFPGLFFRKSVLGDLADLMYQVPFEEGFVGIISRGIFKDFEGKKRVSPEVRETAISETDGEFRVIEEIEPSVEDIDLSESEVVVGGGRGVGGKENFELVARLSALLGGSYGGTRVAVDNRWIDHERQIGRTGKIIKPYLYITFGISGSTHHTFGVKDSKYIISINKDVNAPIFSLSDLKICGDVNEILPLLLERVEKLKRS